MIGARVRSHVPTGSADSADRRDADLAVPQPFRKFGDSFARRAVDGQTMQVAHTINRDAGSCLQQLDRIQTAPDNKRVIRKGRHRRGRHSFVRFQTSIGDMRLTS